MAKVLIMSLFSIAFLVVFFLFRKHPSPLLRSLARIAGAVVVAVIAVFGIVRPYIILEYIIPSRSMEPTLLKRDHIFVNEFIYKFRMPRHGEVIVFSPPAKIEEEADDVFIKRVIGVPGDLLMMRDGKVFRNGKKLDEPYITDEHVYGGMQTTIVPKDTVFVMGDNRNNSDDSRDWGPLDKKKILGRATVRFFPLKRIGYIR